MWLYLFIGLNNTYFKYIFDIYPLTLNVSFNMCFNLDALFEIISEIVLSIEQKLSYEEEKPYY